MGFLSRSGSTATSSRKPPAHNVPSLNPSNLQSRAYLQASVQNVSSNGSTLGLQTSRPPTSTPGAVASTGSGHANENASVDAGAAAIVNGGPAIPARTSSKQATVSDSLAKTLAKKGRQLKTSASKLSLVSNISHSSLWSTASKDYDKSPKKSPTKSPQTPLTHSTSSSISAPTQFQHLTHAVPEQFSKLVAATHSDIVADFSYIRASQTPRRDLRGIKAVDLHSRNSSAETNTSSIVSTEGSASISSATVSIASETSWNSNTSLDKDSPRSKAHRRAQRSQESFSQPFRNGHSPKIGAGSLLAPPPRISSRNAPAISESEQANQAAETETSEEDKRNTIVPTKRDENPKPAFERLSVSKSFPPSMSQDNGLGLVDEAGAALTSPSYQAPQSKESDEYLGRWRRPQVPPPRSSSSDSNLTVTPLNYERPAAEVKPKSQLPLPKTPTRKPVTTTNSKSIQRSSLNNGLFTSWSFDEETNLSTLKHSQARSHDNRPSKKLASEQTPRTKIPTPSSGSPNSKATNSPYSIPIPSRNASTQIPSSRLPTRRGSAGAHHHHISESSTPSAMKPATRHRRASKSSPAVY